MIQFSKILALFILILSEIRPFLIPASLTKFNAPRSEVALFAQKSPPLIKTLTRPPRLPVWPVFPGVLLSVLDLLNLPTSLSATLEDQTFGGRVSPIQFQPELTSPFILLVHHRHRFTELNFLIRKLTEFVLPEGFPAHPHRGFETLTMCMKGGMVHRDSIGVKQVYGTKAPEWCQWLKAGRGVLHEEFWATDMEPDQELYQIWIDSPRDLKMCEPESKLLGDGSGVEIERKDGVEEISVERPWRDGGSSTSVRIVKLERKDDDDVGGVYDCRIPEGHETVILYVKSGSGSGQKGVKINDSEFIPVHSYALLTLPPSLSFTVSLSEPGSSGSSEILLLTGRPLNHPVIAAGSFVMNTETEINQAQIDYSKGLMGKPWDHKIDDKEWQIEVATHWADMQRNERK